VPLVCKAWRDAATHDVWRDVLVDDTVEADVVAHAAWHHLARKATGGAPTHAALFLGESIASAFDLYLVGHLLRQPQRAAYLTTQVPAMAAAAANAGVSDEAFAALLEDVAADPDAAFEDLRALLFDASMALTAAPDADAAVDALDALAEHRFAGLLHHYELAVWTLYARAYARPSTDPDPALTIDAALRAAPSAMEWLRERWLAGAPSGAPRRASRLRS